MDEQMVLLYGQSLLLAGVAAGLAELPGFQVERVSTWADADRMLAEQMPDVLIFELKGICEGHVLPLLLENPHPTMVGLDTECNQAVLLSGRAARSLTLDQLSIHLRKQCARQVVSPTTLPGI
jgi:hypothetical protein